MRKTKEGRAQYMKEYRAKQKEKTLSVIEQRREVIGTVEYNCIDESTYDPDCPKWRSDKTEYTKQEVADNQEWAKQYLIKIGRFKQ